MVIPAQIIAHKIRYLRYQYYNWGDTSVEEEFKDTKEIIRIRKSKKITQGPKGQTTIYKTYT